MFSKLTRIVLLLAFFLGACSSSATEDAVDAGDTVEEVVEETDDELVEEEESDEPAEEEPVEDEPAEEEPVEEEESVEEESVEEENEEEVDERDVAAAESGEVVLLDAGEEPRQELRYTFVEGTEILTLEQSSSQTQTVDGQLLAGGGPPIGTVIDTEVIRTIDGDVMIVDSEIVAVAAAEGTDPTTAALLEESLTPSLGLMTSSRVDTRGVIISAETGATGDPLVDELLSGLEGATNPFPIEAVGVGATWQVDIAQDALGLSIINRSTSVLREFTDNGVIIDVVIEQISNDIGEQVDFGGGVLVTVDAWDVSGSGFVEIAFDKVSPVRAENTVSGTQVFSADGQGTLEQTVVFDTVIIGN